MKILYPVILFLGVVACCHGYSYLIPASQSQAGVCYFNGHVLPRGDSQMPTSCQRLRCNEDGSILVQGCGRINIKDCIVLGPTKKAASYPDCCEMNYECKDSDGRLYVKQWNQLKNGGALVDEGAQTFASNLQQTSENMEAAQKLLEQVKQQSQREGRSDLIGQIDRVESELRILEKITEQQAQQIRRGTSGEENRQAQDQERRIQLVRMEDELSTLVKMSKSVLRLSEEQRKKIELQAKEEVQSIVGFIKQELQKQGRFEALEQQVIRLEGKLQDLAKLRVRQALQIQQGLLGEAERDQQDTQIWTQFVLVENDLNNLIEMWTQGGQGQEQVRNSLDRLVQLMERQIYLQSPEVRAQIFQAQTQLEILSQIKARQSQQGIRGEGGQRQQNQAIRFQRERVEQELRILAQKWTRQIQGAQPIPRIIRLIREQISRQIPLDRVPPGQRSYLQIFLRDVQTLERISEEDQEEGQSQEAALRRNEIENGLKDLLQMMTEGLRRVSGLTIQVEQDILSVLQSVRDQQSDQEQLSQSGIGRQMGDEFDQLTRTLLKVLQERIEDQEGIFTRSTAIGVNRVQGALQALEQLRSQTYAGKDGRQRQVQRVQKRRLIQEIRGLLQRFAQRQQEGTQGIMNRLVGQRASQELQQLQQQAKRVDKLLQTLEEIKTQTEDRDRISRQRWQVVGELKTLMQMWGLGAKTIGQGELPAQFKQDVQAILDIIGQIKTRTQFPRLSALILRIKEKFDLVPSIEGQLERTNLKSNNQRIIREDAEQAMADVWTLLQIFGQEVGGGEEYGVIGREMQLIVSMAKDELRGQQGGEDLDLLGQVNSVEQELQILAQIYARQVRQALERGLDQGQQEVQQTEINLQINRVKGNLMVLLRALDRKLIQARGVEGRLPDGEEPRAILELVKSQIRARRSLQSAELRQQVSLVEQKLRLLAEIVSRQAQRQVLGDEEASLRRQLEIGVEVEKGLRNLLQMILEIRGQGKEILQEARQIIDRNNSEIRKILQRQEFTGQKDQGRIDQQIDRQMERILLNLLQRYQSFQGQGQQVERGQLYREEKQDELELELRGLLSMLQQIDQGTGQQSRDFGIQLFRNQSSNLQRELQNLQQLKAQLSRASSFERDDLKQQINVQRDRIERQLRSIFQEIQDRQAAADKGPAADL